MFNVMRFSRALCCVVFGLGLNLLVIKLWIRVLVLQKVYF
jgi:hypothetical protein